MAAYGFTPVRISGRTHPIYRDETGHTLTVSAHGGRRKSFCRGELVAIRRTVARLLADSDDRSREAC